MPLLLGTILQYL
ncbi:unnamed protein product, partial [Didymodactylos carnosus]